MGACASCPRICNIDRTVQRGFCGAGVLPRVARAALHFGEEPPISGPGEGGRGSGAVFFSGCNMRCVFCQNADISMREKGSLLDARQLAAKFLALEGKGAHNINLVTPTPHIEILRAAIPLARGEGLNIPIAYNTNAYETVEALQWLEGLVDIFLPDLKYVSSDLSEKYSAAPDYFDHAAPAILEMQRQVGTLQLDAAELAVKGLLLRHLVLPGSPDDTRRVLDFIAKELPKGTHVSLMRQYTPRAGLQPPLNRRLTEREYARAVEYCLRLGLEHVYIQEADSANSGYTPAFYDELTDI